MAENTRRQARPIVDSSLSEAAAQSVLDGLDAGFDIEEIAPDKGPKIRGEAKFNQEKLDELVGLASKGAPIAGQSLTKSSEDPYPWETPPEFANTREALDDVKYNIEGNDLDEFDDDDETEEFDGKVNEFRNALTDIKKGATKNIEVSKINTNVVPESILAQIKEKGPEIKSLLDRGET